MYWLLWVVLYGDLGILQNYHKSYDNKLLFSIDVAFLLSPIRNQKGTTTSVFIWYTSSYCSLPLQKHFIELKELVKSTRTVAMGECGIDTSDRRIHISTQIQYLEKQLTLAVKNNLAVVIHCRGDNSAHLAVLQSLTICCPSTLHIHWHCFTGSQEIYNSAVQHFSNIVFGITPFIFGSQYPGLKEFA